MIKPNSDAVRKALESSIQHWEDVLAEPMKTKTTPSQCALCRLFRYSHLCEGCPVFIKTGLINCDGSPYIDFINYRLLLRQEYELSETGLAKLKTLANAELSFLKSLLNHDER